MKLLVLGGTKFLGRATVTAALDRGHEVTLFNRGRTNPELFPDVERLRGDRHADLSALDGRSWDAVLDLSGYVPGAVRASAEQLTDSAAHYLFVSSVSAYVDFAGPHSEGDPVARLEEGQPEDRLLEDYSNYGALKALCEEAVAAAFSGAVTIVRPGLIAGPHDPTGRFTYWPHRVARGGDVLAPAPPEDLVQFVDVHDVADWMVALAEQRREGTFNVTRSGVSWEELLEACRLLSNSDARLVWVDGEFLAEREVGQWMELPMWVHDEELVGIHAADVSRAVAAGLAFRPIEETVRGALEKAETTAEAGLAPEREAALLEAWKARA